MAISTSSTIPITFSVGYSDELITWGVDKKINIKGISPILYFKYVKSKFSLIEKSKLDKKIREIESAWEKAYENGQDVLAEKFLKNLHVTVKEALMSTKGITKYIDKETLNKYKRNIRDGHISDTLFKDYTRVIPDNIIKKKKAVEDIFDDFIIYHYYNENQKDLKKLSSDEKQKMRDPVLFGMIKGSDNLYFIAEWDDEYCDLSFDEITKVVGKNNIGKIEKPKL